MLYARVMHTFLLLVIYISVALAPLAIAQMSGLSPRSFLDEFATGLGLLALAILLMEFVLSGRFRAISGRVGMDRTMRFHQLLARTAGVLLLLHPFIYQTGISFARPWDVTGKLTLGLDSLSIISAVLAWILVVILILFAIFRDRINLSYEAWRRWHGMGALAIVLLSVYHAIEAGRYSGQSALAWFWIALLLLALMSLGWVYAVRPYRQLKTPYTVKSVKKIALKTWEVAITPKGAHRLDFEAGQFVWLNIGNSPYSLHENPFSISTSLAQSPDLGFVIKEFGDFTKNIGRVKPGTVAYLDGPHGHLTLAGRKESGIALIAGGVGIAPLIGILRQLAADNDPRPIILVYGNRTAEQMVYGEELDALKEVLDLKVEYVLSEPPALWSGRLGMTDAALIEDVFSFDGADGWLYLLCGPPAMLESLESCLVGQGVPGSQVVSERFNYD